ncbi:mitochondrial import inner membrane translocase subunit Tim54 [Whalleya microplaca]|nr:mitochondrial import inner membrane translocase subunit Tim54 [Whalleya microplaca]
MADPNPPSAPGAGPASAAPATATPSPGTSAPKPPPPASPPSVLRLLGLPNLPKKLPSRNWMIFFAITGTLSAAIIYDKREKKRATARWARSVAHLAREPVASPTQMPRRLTVFLESPPGDGLRVSQDHYTEYVKPILAASGLDWEFVQGRKEGDVRAAVAERIRRARQPDRETQTQEELVQEIRKRNGTPEYQGAGGDIVIGRHTWKEYVRGIHEGWLGPLTAPPLPEPEAKKVEETTTTTTTPTSEGDTPKPKPEEENPSKKPERPPQPPPYNTPNDYPTSLLPLLIPPEFAPSTPLPFPHILGFSNTLTRLRRFLNRRALADELGREVAAVCLAAAAREYRDNEDPATLRCEQQTALEHEERDWPKAVWKEAAEPPKPETKEGETEATATRASKVPKERIWTQPVVVDPRIGMRMRRFEMPPAEEARARAIDVPEEEVEGWIKGSLRGLYRWAVAEPEPKPYSADE